MMKSMLFFLVLFTTTLTAQTYSVDTLSKEKLSHLAFMSGEWSGSGWMMGRDGKKHQFTQTESIYFKLDSTVLLVEGNGLSDGKPIHKAMALITYNKEEDRYDFQSRLADGRTGTYPAELKDGKLYWYPNENIQYIIEVNEQGQWFETGEMKMGDRQMQFFEMTLERVEVE